MAHTAPQPSLEEIMCQIGEAGLRLTEIGAADGSAGNISVYLPGDRSNETHLFTLSERIELPVPVPELAGGSFLVTGSGRRLREIDRDALACLGLVVVDPDGRTGTLRAAEGHRFERLTVEFNTHLAVHREHALRDGNSLHAVVHAQPTHLTYLSHIPEYRDYRTLNTRILRWEPESIYHLRDGVAVVPPYAPASEPLMSDTLAAMREHQIVLWAKHGVIARSGHSVKRACDLIEFAEVGARFEVMNLQCGERGEGLTPDEIRTICTAFDIQQDFF